MAVGVGLTAAGVAVLFWTARALGWRRFLYLSDDPPHPALPPLVFRGPYQFVRHPAFLGVLLTVVGTRVAAGRPPTWVLVAGVVALVARARAEERHLLARFGEAYRRYRHAVPFLVPWFRAWRRPGGL